MNEELEFTRNQHFQFERFETAHMFYERYRNDQSGRY